MEQWKIRQTVDLAGSGSGPQAWSEALMVEGDKDAHTWSITVLNGGQPVNLAGAAPICYFTRADNATIPIQGSISGNVVSVTFSLDCYAIKGPLVGIFRLLYADVTLTLSVMRFTVGKGIGSSVIVDPDGSIPDLETLLEQIARIEAAIQTATTAAREAQNAADRANQAADSIINGGSGGGGGTGQDGGYYIPTVNAQGMLSWAGSKAGMPAVAGANIRGPEGAEGYSPTITLTRLSNGVQIKATNKDSEATVMVYDGTDGAGGSGGSGQDGGYYIPSVSAQGMLSWSGSKSGMPDVAAANIRGSDGYSPTITLTRMNNGVQIKATNKDSESTEMVYDGEGGEGGSGSVGQDGGYYIPTVNAQGVLSWEGSQTGMPDVESANIKGPQGDSKVYVGTDTPPDTAEVWIHPLGTLPEQDQGDIQEIVRAQLLSMYPIGSIYISTASTSPASFIGGTWEQIKDRFLLSAGGNYGAGSTGGEASHALTEAEMPSHRHVTPYKVDWGSSSGLDPYETYWESGTIGEVGSTAIRDKWHPNSTRFTGGSAAHNNMPPYLAVYMWKRVR